MKTTDTIAAISTAVSPSGIGIIRISGEDAITIADKVFKGKKKLCECETHTINYGFVYDGDEKVDQVLVVLMKAPHSYTGEDIVEIDCHGGVLVLEKILKLVLFAGANLAEPGEFTKRAFLNGKMDLSQAEAVADIIDAGNDYALKIGERQLAGSVAREVRELRAKLLLKIAFIEAALDDPEHYNFDGFGEELTDTIKEVEDRIDKLIKNSESGIVMKNGINTVILGKPNAGKSSLYNLMTRSDRAIVTSIAGTTRDTLTEHIRMSGISLNITDTAGIRESDDLVEKIGVDRAKRAAKDADMLILIIDGSLDFSDEDRILLGEIEQKNAVVLINKSDLGLRIRSEEIEKYTKKPVILFSAKDGTGLEELEKAIKHMFYNGEINLNDGIYITSVRQKKALEDAKQSLSLVRSGIENYQPEDMLAIDLMDAYESLGVITGETVGDEVINEIFSKFCMGK